MTDTDPMGDTPGTALAVAPGTLPAGTAPNQEWIARESTIQLLESEARGARDAYVRSTLELGRILAEHSDLCRDQDERPLALWESLGFTPSSAYRAIRVYRTVRQIPTLRDLAERHYCHAVALIEGTDDDLLRQIASGEQEELPLDDTHKMPVRQLRARVRALSEDMGKEVRKATKALTAERDALIRERDRLAALTGDDLDSVRRTVRILRDQASAVAATLTGLHRQIEEVRNLDTSPRGQAILPRGQILLDEIERELHGYASAAQAVWQTWMERREQDWGRPDDTLPLEDRP